MVADAGADQGVESGNSVQLDGSASSDPNGSITGYDWAQESGPTVTLDDPTSPTPSFTAPQVTTDTLLSFRLTVTDDDGITADDTVAITVSPAGPDTTAPVTKATVVESSVKGAPHFDVTLAVNEPATTWYRVSGDGSVTAGDANTADWQTYTTTVHVENPKKGVSTFEYYSVDTAGNQETAKTEVLQ